MPLDSRLGTGIEGLPAELWQRLRGARPRLLMLDYDGTLAPFEAERMRARMPVRSLRALWRIAEEVRDSIAIVSGRPLDELIALLEDLPAHVVGSHGWEQRTREGHRISETPLPRIVELLALAHSAAVIAGWHAHLELKPAAVMLHTRGLPDDAARELERECEKLWRRQFLREGLELQGVDGGVELRASARDKGRVVRDLLRWHPETRLAAYLGDDIADERAFEVLRHDGITVRVGPDPRPSRALWRLESPEAVSHFLERWAESVR